MSDISSHLQRQLSGTYTLERELGGGGMSRVFLAEETRLGRKVVVKVLSPELAAGLSAEPSYDGHVRRGGPQPARGKAARLRALSQRSARHGCGCWRRCFSARRLHHGRDQRGVVPRASAGRGPTPRRRCRTVSTEHAAFADRPYFRARLGVRLGRAPDRAREVVRQFQAAADTAQRRAFASGVAGAMGDIAIAEGKPRDAVPLLRQSSESQLRPYSRDPSLVFARVGRAFDLAHEPDSAIVAFELFLATPSYDRFNTPIDPTYRAAVHKRLGELYEAKGERAKVASNYSKFVDLWKNADPELQPKVAAVRARLARLGDLESKR